MQKKPTLYLHIGMHKTGTSYLQNLFSLHRGDLLEAESLLYPSIGYDRKKEERIATRDGATSGQSVFTRATGFEDAIGELAALCDEAKPKSVLISSENFTNWDRDIEPGQYIDRFNYFDEIKVILLVRRQDRWVESMYRQVIDQYICCETDSIEEYVQKNRNRLFDYRQRFEPWRNAVGSDNFIVGSYDDLSAANGLLTWFTKQLGLSECTKARLADTNAPSYPSISGYDTFILRLLNQIEVPSRDARTQIACDICACCAGIDCTLLQREIAEDIQAQCAEQNAWIADNWIATPAVRFRGWDDLNFRTEPLPSIENDVIQQKLRVLLPSFGRHTGTEQFGKEFAENKRILQERNEDLVRVRKNLAIKSKKLKQRNAELAELRERYAEASKKSSWAAVKLRRLWGDTKM